MQHHLRPIYEQLQITMVATIVSLASFRSDFGNNYTWNVLRNSYGRTEINEVENLFLLNNTHLHTPLPLKRGRLRWTTVSDVVDSGLCVSVWLVFQEIYVNP